jgi:hypothetical protein
VLAVLSAGAYGMAMASNYNTRPRAAEVLMVDNGRAMLIRSARRWPTCSATRSCRADQAGSRPSVTAWQAMRMP